MKEGVLYQVFVGQDEKSNNLQFVAPTTSREEVLEALHSGIAGEDIQSCPGTFLLARILK